MDAHTYVVNVEGVVVRGDEYLLVERAADEDHATGALAFPGGKVEEPPGEDLPIEMTARRELSEEVGIDVGNVEYVRSRTFKTDTGQRCLNVITTCEYLGGEATPCAPGEVSAVHWLSTEEIRDRANVPDYLERDVAYIEARR